MFRSHLWIYAVLFAPTALLLGACSGSSGDSGPGTGAATGGALSVGGGTAAGTTGGAATTAGGAAAKGGATASGGATATGGAVGSGGSPATGGAVATGGQSSVGGSTATGGVIGVGGAVGTGGTPATGGAIAIGGKATGGTTSAGGAANVGGAKATGGSPGTGGASATGGAATAGGNSATGGAATCSLPAASQFQTNLTVGGGGTPYKESDHFVVFGSASVDATLNLLEAAYQCYVEEWCWRWPGLSITSTSGTYYKFNLYQVNLSGAAGVMQYDRAAGISYIEVVPSYSATPGVSVHEFGHSLTLAEKNWVEQGRTGLWWESMANFVSDTFQTSTICAKARTDHNITGVRSELEPATVISNANMIICQDGNHYQAWPIWAYLTNNPDNYAGLGKMAVPNVFRTYKINSNETPLHTLERMVAPTTIQTVIGRYWAHMAYVDIGNPMAQQAFSSARSKLNFTNLTSSGSGKYTVIAARQPKYMGANINPLTVSGGSVSVQVTNLGNGRTDSGFTATLAIRATSANTVRYVDLPNGSGQATIASGEEVSLVVVNTPTTLYLYDPSNVGASDPANLGLNYSVQLTGATPTNL